MTDRASLNGILERTDAYATGSGFIDKESVHGIRVIPLEDGNANTLIFIKKKGQVLSEVAKSYKRSLENYFEQNKFWDKAWKNHENALKNGGKLSKNSVK